MPVNVPFSYIAREIQDNDLKYWDIKDDKKLIARNDTDLMTSESINLLSEKLAAINGTVKVMASTSPSANRSGGAEAHKTRTFYIDTTSTPITKEPEMMTNYHNPNFEKLQHEILNLEREKLALKYAVERWEDKYNDLENRYNELKKELEETETDENGIAGFSPKLIETVLMTYLTNGLTPQTPAPAPPINGTPETWEAYQRIEPEADKIITAIIQVKKTDPGTYAMIKKMLLTNY